MQTASFGLSKEFIQKEVVQQLENNPSADISCQIEVHDSQSNHLCSVVTNWQIKDWQKGKDEGLISRVLNPIILHPRFVKDTSIAYFWV